MAQFSSVVHQPRGHNDQITRLDREVLFQFALLPNVQHVDRNGLFSLGSFADNVDILFV
jgi:hypothetical protein